MKRYLGLLVGIGALALGIPTASAASIGQHRHGRHHHKKMVHHHLIHHLKHKAHHHHHVA